MKPLKTKISVTVDNDLVTEARLLAEKEDRSLSQIVNLALKALLRPKKDEN